MRNLSFLSHDEKEKKAYIQFIVVCMEEDNDERNTPLSEEESSAMRLNARSDSQDYPEDDEEEQIR